MPSRRILSLWFPRLAAERVLRAEPALAQPLAVVADLRGALVLASLSALAEAAGLRRGMALGDARAVCPRLATRPEVPHRDAAFLAALGRWAGRFSPWVAAEGGEGLVLDVTGCAHIFGGEVEMAARVAAEAAAFGLTLCLGLADSRGAAWAVARHAGEGALPRHAGDAIDQEARATRSRAARRAWDGRQNPAPGAVRLVPPGATLAHVGPLPVAALRLAPAEVTALNALGLRRVIDLLALPRAQLARRVGTGVLLRLDQALGRQPESVAADRPPPVLAVRLTLPEPIGLLADVLAGIDRLLPALCARLQAAGRGARRLRLTLTRTDGRVEEREVGLARPADRPETIRPLLALRLDGAGDILDVEGGCGIERLRLAATVVEPMRAEPLAQGRRSPAPAREVPAPEVPDFADLIGRLGARLGGEAVVRLHPADSHIPEKAATEMPAAFSPPAAAWPPGPAPRPILVFPPEPVLPEPVLPDLVLPDRVLPDDLADAEGNDGRSPPERFIWRRRHHRRACAFGPERIAPEWWLDDPAWRSGVRDYWRVETEAGDRLWLFAARGAEMPGGWFAQGVFA